MKTLSQRGGSLLALLSLGAMLVCVTAASAALDLQPLVQALVARNRPDDQRVVELLVGSSSRRRRSPTASSAAAVDSDGAAFRQEAQSSGASYKERMHFKTLWNGVSIEAEPGCAGEDPPVRVRQGRLPGPDARDSRHDPGVAGSLDGAGDDRRRHRAERARTHGRGVKVAVIDTGIDYDHPDLGGCFGRRLPRRHRLRLRRRRLQRRSDVADATTRSRTRIRSRTTATATARTSAASSAPTAHREGVAPGVTFAPIASSAARARRPTDIMSRRWSAR